MQSLLKERVSYVMFSGTELFDIVQLLIVLSYFCAPHVLKLLNLYSYVN